MHRQKQVPTLKATLGCKYTTAFLLNLRTKGRKGACIFLHTKIRYTQIHTWVPIHDSFLAEPADEKKKGGMQFITQTKADTHTKSHAGV